MGIFHDYPYTNFHELNIDWILKKMKELDEVVEDFVAFNKITFSGSWDGNITYPAWTIVDDGSGNGYISIKAVPANVPLSNSDYWQKVADYDALYAAFDQRISDLEDRIGIMDHVYLCISDSYGTDSVGSDRLSWNTQLASIMGLTQGVNYFESHTAGAGFAHNGGAPGSPQLKNFCDVLNNAIASMTTAQMESVTDLIIGGGVNDWDGTDADTTTGIRNFDSIARANFPNVKIWLIGCGWAKRADIRAATIQRYAVYQNIGGSLGWIVNTKAYQALQNKNNFVSDGVHPTVAGSRFIAQEITNLLSGNNQPALNLEYDNIMINGTSRGRAYVADNIVHAYIGTFSPGALPDLGANSEIDVIEISCPYLFGGGSISEEYPAELSMEISGDSWTSTPVKVFLRYDAANDKTILCIHNNAQIIPSGGFGSYADITDSYLSIGKIEISPYC